MTFVAIVLGLWLLAAFFTWALCVTAARADSVWPEIVESPACRGCHYGHHNECSDGRCGCKRGPCGGTS